MAECLLSGGMSVTFQQEWKLVATALGTPVVLRDKVSDRIRRGKEFSSLDILEFLLREWSSRCSSDATINHLVHILDSQKLSQYTKGIRTSGKDEEALPECENFLKSDQSKAIF